MQWAKSMDTDQDISAISPGMRWIYVQSMLWKIICPILWFQNYINSLLNDINGTVNEIIPSWVPDNIKKYKGERVQMKLLCGADLLESFAVKNLWDSEDVSHESECFSANLTYLVLFVFRLKAFWANTVLWSLREQAQIQINSYSNQICSPDSE